MRFIALALLLAAAHVQAVENLCTKDEAVVFACPAEKSRKYSVFSYYEEEEKPALRQGVRVTRGRQSTQRLCAEGAVDELSQLESAVPCDEGNALASCP